MPNMSRPHPQTSFRETTVNPESFYGKLRTLYANTVLKTQLDQLRKQGSYDAFKLQWHPAYDVRRLTGARTRLDGIPPSLFWESDVGKWIEAACYFLSTDAGNCAHKDEFESAIQELVDMIEKAQQPDGYLNIYFTVVDPEGRFKNLRDMHEMYNAGHLLEGSLAHYQYTGSRQFLDVMIKNIDCFRKHLGPGPNQLHGYPGHPELELAVLRLYAVTNDPKHLDFAQYLLSERGVTRPEQNNLSYYLYEAQVRKDEVYPHTMNGLEGVDYHQAHLPLHEQDAILGHSVRALYLTTAAADLGGDFLDDAKRLFDDATKKKMYVTGGLGTEPRLEGFSAVPYWLPQSTGEGGCYAETCASIAAMMTGERILSHGLDAHVRDTLELCFLNAVLGGGSLNGKAFAYANKMQTYGDEVATRADWFEVCCCPPNLSRTLGMLGGYTSSVKTDDPSKVIAVNVYLFVSATRKIALPSGESATISMKSEMPWHGQVEFDLDAPPGWTWQLQVPTPAYAANIQLSATYESTVAGFASIKAENVGTVKMTFDMPITLVAPHIESRQDTLTVKRGPIVFVAESYDNAALEKRYKHFNNIGIAENTTFKEQTVQIEGIDTITLQSNGGVYCLKQSTQELYRAVGRKQLAREWEALETNLTLVPWFARANRGGAAHVRTSFMRATPPMADKTNGLNGVNGNHGLNGHVGENGAIRTNGH